MDEKKNETNKISEGLIVAAAAPIAYLFAFIYEAGSNYVYKIPMEFISISLTNIFIAGASFILIGIFLIILIDLFSMIFYKAENPIISILAQIFPIFIGSLAYIYFALGTPLIIAWPGIVIGWIYIIFIIFVFPLIAQRGEKGYKNKLIAQSTIDTKGILGDLARKFRGSYMLAFYLGISLYIAYFAGMSSAFRKTYYLVTNTTPEMVVLKVYNDRLIVAPIDRINRVITSEFLIINLDDINIPILNLENIGQIGNP